jgi:hypothetical protein
MVGDPAYDPAPLVGETAAHSVVALRHAFAVVAGVTAVDPARAAAWAFARHVEYVLWLVDRGELAELDELMATASALATAAGI